MNAIPIFQKQWSDLWREKTFLLVIGLIVFVIISLSMLIAVTAFVYNPEYLQKENLNVGFVGYTNITGYSRHIDWYTYDTDAEALQAFDNSTIDAIVLEVNNDPYTFEITLSTSPVKNSLATALLKDTFQQLEDSIISSRGDINTITPIDVSSRQQGVRGLNKIFEILFGFALPLFLLIPIFLIGNLFIDTITEDFERKNNHVLFTSYSPKKYVKQMLLFGLTLNTALVVLMQIVLYLRFSFLENPLFVFTYVTLFFGIIAQLSIALAFAFKLKTTAQLSYSFAVLSIFLLSSNHEHLPIKVISQTMLNIEAFHPVYILWTILGNLLLWAFIYYRLKKEYYV